ncbi:MAG TPA: plastocyanin/azurin family copper-binding protein [Thermoleophilaceae bacterium]|nr:plastocyanin/azurin family copper-binding protein [Thermoleophilaceae bacterium]
MRPNRLAIPLAILLSLVLAAPAGAAFDWKTQVIDFEFQPAAHKISVGDTVTWNFQVGGHTSASVGGQPDSWKSIETGSNPAGTSYTRQFNTPGKYQYVCLQHRDFMKGSIEVGTDAVIDSIDNFKTKRIGHRVKIRFLLNEAAKVTYKLTGPSRRTVKKGRLDPGTHSFTLKRLKKGTYRGKLTVVDDFDKTITPRNFFVIR